MSRTFTLEDLDRPEVADALAFLNFQTGPIARVFQMTGEDIKHRCEDEQVYVLRWFVKLALEHGPGWRDQAQAEIDRRKELWRANQAESEA